VGLRHCETSQIQLQQHNIQEYSKRKPLDFFRSSPALACKLVGPWHWLGDKRAVRRLWPKAPTARCFTGRARASCFHWRTGGCRLLPQSRLSPIANIGWDLRPLARVPTILDHSSLAATFSATDGPELLAPAFRSVPLISHGNCHSFLKI
jgi:hypothetical protein